MLPATGERSRTLGPDTTRKMSGKTISFLPATSVCSCSGWAASPWHYKDSTTSPALESVADRRPAHVEDPVVSCDRPVDTKRRVELSLSTHQGPSRTAEDGRADTTEDASPIPGRRFLETLRCSELYCAVLLSCTYSLLGAEDPRWLRCPWLQWRYWSAWANGRQPPADRRSIADLLDQPGRKQGTITNFCNK